TEEYNPFIGTGDNHYSTANLGWLDASHPLMDGVSQVTGYFRDYVSLASNATLVAQWDDEELFVAVKDDKNVIYVNVGIGDSRYHSWGSDDLEQLLTNALFFGGFPWLAAIPESGQLLPGASMDFQIKFDAREIIGGNHDAYVVVTARDAVSQQVTIPAHLFVYPPVMTVTPEAFEVVLVQGESTVETMTIGNEGESELRFEIDMGGDEPVLPPIPYDMPSKVTVKTKDKVAPTRDVAPAKVVTLPSSMGGPDGYGYTYRDSRDPNGPAYEWIEIATPEGGSGLEIDLLTGEDDAVFWSLTLPFAFNFYGTDYTDLAISTNGTIFFEDGYMDYENQPIPQENYYDINRFIAHFWDDTYVYPGAIYYLFEEDRAIIEFYQTSMCCPSPDWGTWQVILFANGNILFQYKEMDFGEGGGYGDYGVSAVIGIQGDAYTGLEYSAYTPSLEDEMAILFVSPDWLQIEPTAGTVPAAGSEAISLTLDASYMLPGVYESGFTIRSNDPDRLEFKVPVMMRVLPTPIDPPQIIAIEDVPDDQGGWVVVGWRAAPDDQYFSDHPVASYSVWMRKPYTSEEQAPILADKLDGDIGVSLAPALAAQLSEDGKWIGIGSIDAVQDSIYAFPVPTLADSNQTGAHWTVVRISAHTADPYNYVFSEADSGYSVDNIEPGVPLDLAAVSTGEGVQLSWSYDMDAVEDFQYFAVYRGQTADFEPVHPDSTYHRTTETTFVDAQVILGVVNYYRIAAVDHNGNTSELTGAVSGSLLSLMDGTSIPETFALHQNHPNPFNPSTTIRFDVPEASDVKLVVYNILGREVIRLREGYLDAGYHQVVWNGRTATGREVPTGVYVLRLTSKTYTQNIKMVLMK
ncbi:MAG: T9SS type A sorting domain-containing protein, partial [Fidelibacterota bacterium]